MRVIPSLLILSLNTVLAAGIINVPADYTTIQAALNAAQTGDTVLVQPSTYYENIIWPDVNGIKLISAGDSSNTVIDGGGISSVIYMNPSSATIDTITMIKGFMITHGGNISNGGGLVCINASPTIEMTMITLNSVSVNGGGGYFNNSHAAIRNSTILTNTSAYLGGGLYLTGSNIQLANVNIYDNSSDWEGGGIYIDESNPTIDNCSIESNHAIGHDGGGIYSILSNPIIKDSELSNNFAISGGAIYFNYGSPSISNTLLSYNTASSQGGGIACFRSMPTLINVTMYRNTASQGGGYLSWPEGVNFNNVIVAGNFASGNAGGIYLALESNTSAISGLNLIGNRANGVGGGLYLSNCLMNITNCTISRNISDDSGDGIYTTDGSNLSLENSNIVKNGVGVYNADNSEVLDAINNWWGDASGPHHPSQNPNGRGDSVNAFVNISPFLTEPDISAPPIPVQNFTVVGTGNDFISLGWDASPLGDLAGYKVYYDTDSTGFPYANTVDVGTDTSYTLSGLPLGTTFYLAVTCYDTDGNESWYSEEVSAVTRILEVQNLDIGGDENLQHLVTHTPAVSFDYYDSIGEPQTSYHIQVSTQPDFSTVDMWDTGEVVSDATTVTYAGSSLEDGQTYYLRVKVASGSFWSDWTTLEFRMNSEPLVPVAVAPISNAIVSPPVILKVLNSTDAEGNILTYSFRIYGDASLSTLLDSAIAVLEGPDTTSWQVVAELTDNEQYWWIDSANDGYEEGAVSDAVSFLLNAVNDAPEVFALLSPQDSAEVGTLTPLLDWELAFDPDPVDTVRYSLYLDTPDPGVEVISVDTATSFQIASPLSDNTTYYWKVVARDLSGATTVNTGGYHSFRVNIENDPPGEFALVSPADGAMVVDLTPEFHWQESVDPDDPLGGVAYRFYLSSDSLFTGVTPVDMDTSSYALAVALQEDEVYYWKVVAVDSHGGETFSEVWWFWTNSANSTPGEFTLISPQNDSELTSLTLAFAWHPAEDADIGDSVSYDVELGESVDSLAVVYTGTDTTYTPASPLTDNTTYYLKVVARDLSGATKENTGGYHRFISNVENEPPSIVFLVTPSDSSIEITLKPNFYWTKAVDPDPDDMVAYGLYYWQEGTTPPDSLMLDTNSVEIASPLEDNSQYRWAVKIYDNHGARSISDTVLFWTDAYPEPPLQFATIWPAIDTTGLLTSVEFIWHSTVDPDPLDQIVYVLTYATDWSDSLTYARIEGITDTTMSLTLEDNTEYFWLVEAMDKDSLITGSNDNMPVRFVVGYLLGVDAGAGIPEKYALHQNYPNPFNPTSTIQYDLPEATSVRILVYDIMGREIVRLLDGYMEPGFHQVVWNGRDGTGRGVTTGIYITHLVTPEYTKSIKMLLLK